LGGLIPWWALIQASIETGRFKIDYRHRRLDPEGTLAGEIVPRAGTKWDSRPGKRGINQECAGQNLAEILKTPMLSTV